MKIVLGASRLSPCRVPEHLHPPDRGQRSGVHREDHDCVSGTGECESLRATWDRAGYQASTRNKVTSP